MPFPNFHAARLRDPDDFKAGSFRTVSRRSESFDDKPYNVIRGRLRSNDQFEDQALRYPIEHWTEAQARRHAREHEATNFEKATGEEAAALVPAEYLTLPTTSVWAIYPSALADMSEKLRALQFAGPVEDARRGGVPVAQVGRTAVIPVEGPLTKSRTILSLLFGGHGMANITEALRAAVADDTVEKIILRIDSPGGSVDGLLDLMAEVRAAGERKPVEAQVDGIAASGAWFVASQARRIMAGASDLVGSVGVRMMMVDFSKAFEAEGLRAIPIDTGDFKSAGARGTEVTDEHVAAFQEVVDDIFAQLRAAVLEVRKMSAAKFEALSDGRIHVGEKAVALGLADKVVAVRDMIAGLHQDARRRRRRGRMRTDVERLKLKTFLTDVRG